MGSNTPHVRWFKDLGLRDVPKVGGKTASLGELYSLLSGQDVGMPNGFALTADAYRDALTQANAWPQLEAILNGLRLDDITDIAARAAQARAIVYDATSGAGLARQIGEAFQSLRAEYGRGLTVAVRSSATAEDLPTASFAGQHDSYLHIRAEAELVEACRRCFASLFTDRAIVYRANNGFEHLKVALSVAVMKMVRSDEAASGVAFTLDTETGFRDVVFVTGAWGLGENVVQGTVAPDEFYVHKPTFVAGHRAVLRRSLGSKETRLAWRRGLTGGELHAFATRRKDRERYCLSDEEVLSLAGVAISIEAHYSQANGRPTPMDLEWAKDADDGRLYILQARPETVASRRAPESFETYRLRGSAALLTTGKAVGEKIAVGRVRLIEDAADLKHFQAGEVLVARSTSPDWLPVMRAASAIVTDQGGRTCHAAIVARELGVPAVVGAGDATRRLASGAAVTVSCAEGDVGRVYDGEVRYDVERLALDQIPRPRTEVMVNLAHPGLAFRTGLLPSSGVGLARLEFIIGEEIGIHPMAAAHPDRVEPATVRRRVERLAKGHAAPRDYFVSRLSEDVGTIAAAFWPRPVIVRLSDFKTNEYARLLGGAAFELEEENPMLGFVAQPVTRTRATRTASRSNARRCGAYAKPWA